jgi:hypothetical protein
MSGAAPDLAAGVSGGRWRRNAHDAWRLFLFPLGIALLPWSLGFAVLRRVAMRPGADEAGIEAAWGGARAHLGAVDKERWKQGLRLLRRVETVDTWLLLLRSARWWRRQVDVDAGSRWPQPGQAHVLLTFHWGAGQWLWAELHARDLPAHFVARRPAAGDLGISATALLFGALRRRALRRLGGFEPLYTGGSSERLTGALRAGRSLVGMLDLPAGEHQRTADLALLDGTVRFPTGLVHLAEREGATLAIISCGLDPDSGRRTLRVETLPPATPVGVAMARYAQHLDRRLRETPEAWQLWQEATRMFDRTGEGREP